jgi:hypothetical protein
LKIRQNAADPLAGHHRPWWISATGPECPL